SHSAAAASLRPRWTPLRQALALTCGLRLFYTLIAAALSPYLRLDSSLIHSNQLTENLMSRDGHPFLYALFGVWERFDTLWYIRIARHGYTEPMATVFYPLYPALIRAFSWIAGSDLAAALSISTAASFLLCWGAIRLLGVWPASFIFLAGYPDSLLCALIVWSLYFARAGRPLPSGALGFAAGLTKALGGFLSLPLLWIAWKGRKRKREARRNARAFAAALLPAAAIGCFQTYLALAHFPPAEQIYKTYWTTSTAMPWTTLLDAVTTAFSGRDLLLILNLTVFLIIGTAALLPPVRIEYKALTVAAMCLFLTKHTQPLLQSTMRYSLTIFAAFPSLAWKGGTLFAFFAMIAGALNLLL